MPHISITAEKLFDLYGLPVTNTLLTSWLVVILLATIAIFIHRRIKAVPGITQNIAEIAIEKMLDFFETVAGSREKAEKFFPLVATIFIFILAANRIGIVPGVGSIGFTEHEEFAPLLRSMNSDLNMTLALALVAVVLAHFFGIVSIGLKGHISKFINFKSPIAFFSGILELIGEVSRVLSFSFRLFGNVFAGEVLLVIISFLVPYLAPVPFLGMELFVGFIQALIFATLTMLIVATFTEAHESH